MLYQCAAWVLTFILGNVPNIRIIPLSEDSKQQKELLVDPNPPLTSNEEYLNMSSNQATRLSIRSPCLSITKLALDWMRNHILWPYLEFWKTQDRVSYFLWNLGDYSAYLLLFSDETPRRTTFLLQLLPRPKWSSQGSSYMRFARHVYCKLRHRIHRLKLSAWRCAMNRLS